MRSGYRRARPPALQSAGGQGHRNQADRREPPLAARLRVPRARRGGHRADRHRGEGASRGARPARAGVRRHPRRRDVAHRRLDLGVRAGQHLEPRHRPRPEATAEAQGDRQLTTRRCARRGSRSCQRSSTSRTARSSSRWRSAAARTRATSGARSPTATPSGRWTGRSRRDASSPALSVRPGQRVSQDDQPGPQLYPWRSLSRRIGSFRTSFAVCSFS